MTKRIITIAVVFFLAVLMCFLQSTCSAERYQAATSYTNAKEFYESTAKYGKPYRAEANNGKIYYATKAKLASSAMNTRYYTLGFDVTLLGNGNSVSFTVSRDGGSMRQIDSRKDDEYEFILYSIDEDTLYRLASKSNTINIEKVLEASSINVQMNAIMTTIEGGNKKGGITENGYGGFTQWGKIYRLKKDKDLKELKGIFKGHEFESYKLIEEYLDNYLLKVRYNVLGLNSAGGAPVLRDAEYSFDLSGFLQKNGKIYTDESRTLKKITVLNTEHISLSKEGYHLPKGREWVTADQRYFASNTSYQSTKVDSTIGYQNHGITLYANWKPNAIKINYNSNGGSGTMTPTSTSYDKTTYLSKSTFTRTGYDFKGWNTNVGGSGISYLDGQLATNIISGGEITLYAQWEPCVYQITTDSNYDFFEKFAIGFYSDGNTENGISYITIPFRTGYTFMGCYTYMQGGQIVIDSTGKINVPNTFFKKDSMIYADFKANQYEVNFDKLGGIYGTDSVTATYDQVFPRADAPVRTGYVFKGYYTEKNGKGTCIYNENMVSECMFQYTNDITLYAHWIDERAPELTLNVSHDTWTNQQVTLTAEAWDAGEGLSSVVLYHIDADHFLTEVDRADNLNGAQEKELTFVNSTEGIVRYKVVATDLCGNESESYNVVYYDTKGPTGTVIAKQIEDGRFYFEIDITDINNGN